MGSDRYPAAHSGVAGLTLGLAGVTLGALSCIQTTTHHPVGSSAALTLQTVPSVASWDVVVRGAAVGSVVRFEREGDAEFLFVVRNSHGQDLGFVDARGCAWRRRPHAADERLGAGTLEAGAASILGTHGELQLVARATADADAPPGPP